MCATTFSYVRVDASLLRTDSLKSCGRGHFCSCMETWESREGVNSPFSSETDHLLPQVASHRWRVPVGFTENLSRTPQTTRPFTMSSSLISIGWLKPKVRQATKDSKLFYLGVPDLATRTSKLMSVQPP